MNKLKFYSLILLFSVFIAEDKKVALVLSGGAAKGYAHIPVLEIIDSLDINIDMIVGTSIGANVGALYSVGYDSKDILNFALRTDWSSIFLERTNRTDMSYLHKKDESKYQIDFNLKDFTSNTITVPKVQEISSITLLGCFFPLETKKFDAFNCEESLHKEIKQELLKRIYKPIYIPLITILCCFLIITSRNNVNYEKFRKIIFLFTFVILVFSETSLRYSTISTISMIIYLVVPWIIFIFAYFIFYNRVKNV